MKGYETPEEGQRNKNRNHTVWVRRRDDLWYSPKDLNGLSGVARHRITTEHVRILRKMALFREICWLSRDGVRLRTEAVKAA
jgi:hypothetical protein